MGQSAYQIAMKEMGDLIELANLKQPLIDGIELQIADIAINVKTFGAIGNNIVDDSNAIDTAIAHCVALVTQGFNPVLMFPAATGYATTRETVIPKGISVMMDAPIKYNGSINETCLTIGSPTIANVGVPLKLMVEKNAVSNWSSEDSTGIRIYNANTCEIEIVRSVGFTIGVQFMGSGSGVSYNNIYLGYLINNKIGLNLSNENGGWCNENNFFGGRFGVFSGVGAGLARYGVRITSKATYYNNNNVFHKPSFELLASGATPSEAVPILMEFGNLNLFRDCRNEGNSTTFARELNESTQNVYRTGFGDCNIDSQSRYPQYLPDERRREAINTANNVVFMSGPLHKKACYYDGSTSVNVPSVHLSGSGNANVNSNLSTITIASNYLEFSSARGVSIFVNTINSKRFVVRKDVESGFGGRIGIRCYDASGNILTNLDANHPYVKGAAFSEPTFSSTFGGCYRTGADSTSDFYFTVGTDVAYVVVILMGGTTNIRLRSFSIFALDGRNAATWVGYEEVIPSVNLGTAAPTTGTWTIGRRIYHPSPSNGGIEYWDCTATGTPGTWISKQIGVLSSIAATPLAVGFLAVSGGNAYMSVGVASAADWKQITN